MISISSKHRVFFNKVLFTDRNPTTTSCFWVCFTIITAACVFVLSYIYKPFAYTTFSPIDLNASIEILDFKPRTCYMVDKDNDIILETTDYIWTIQITDKNNNNLSYGHACASVYAHDYFMNSVICGRKPDSHTKGEYPYERNPYEDNILHWFCYQCRTNGCLEFIPHKNDTEYFIDNAYISNHPTHSTTLDSNITVKAHDIVPAPTPYFPTYDWNWLWVMGPLCLIIIIFFGGIQSMFSAENDIDNMNVDDTVYYDQIKIIKILEAVGLTCYTVISQIYLFSYLTFTPYSDETGFFVHMTYWFWLMTIAFDVTIWVYAMCIYAERNGEGITWQRGFLPVVGPVFRFTFDKPTLMRFVTFHDMTIYFFAFFNVCQLGCVVYYCFWLVSSIAVIDLIYVSLLGLNVLLVAFDILYTSTEPNVPSIVVAHPVPAQIEIAVVDPVVV